MDDKGGELKKTGWTGENRDRWAKRGETVDGRAAGRGGREGRGDGGQRGNRDGRR